MQNLITRSFINAFLTAAYIVVLVETAFNGEKFFGTINQNVAPIIFLMTFVTSAGITGGLVLGKPVMLYFENKKMEAVKLFFYTLGWLALGTLILVIVNIQK